MQHQQVIKDIEKQRQILEGLMDRLEKKESLDSFDYQIYDMATREVEKGLKHIRKTLRGNMALSQSVHHGENE